VRWWLAERLVPVLGRRMLFRLGDNRFRRRDFPRAARFLGPAARRQHVGAQYRMGQLYLSGEGVPPSRAEAARWFGAGARADHTRCQWAYAELLWSEGADFDRDVPAAIGWAARAAEAGLPEAQAMLGKILCFGPDDLRNDALGEALLRRADEAGQAEASLGLGLLMNRQAAASPAAAAAAQRFFARAAEGGSAHAMYALGLHAEQDAREDGDMRAAGAFYRDAATGGHRAAQTRWGMFLVEGRGCDSRPVEGESWLRKAALGGDGAAAAWLGAFYARPGPLPPNVAEATAWYRRALALEHFDALPALQVLVDAGQIPVAEMTAAVASVTDARGQYVYGRLLERRATTPVEQAEVRRWMARATAGGSAAAKAVLAEMMLHGRGGPRDVAGAVALFEEAAAADHLGALFALGVLYAGVDSVTPDLPRSEAALRQAAARGHGPASEELDRLLRAGHYGVASQSITG
jgi:uncharacterized protein